MPCRSGYEDGSYYEERANFAEAALCAILSIHAKNNTDDLMIGGIDQKESGVSINKLRQWWKDHQAQDEKRKAHERAERENDKKREQALKKLTEQERSLLGLT